MMQRFHGKNLKLKGPPKFVFIVACIIAFLLFSFNQPKYILQFGIIMTLWIIPALYYLHEQEILPIKKK